MNEPPAHLIDLEARVAALLNDDARAWNAALALAGLPTFHGRPQSLERLATRASELQIDADAAGLAALRGCDDRLESETGTALGETVAEAQGLVLSIHYLHERTPLPLAAPAAMALAAHAAKVLLDGEGVAALVEWRDRYQLNASHALILPIVQAPLTAMEWILGARTVRRATATLTPESEDAWLREVAACFEFAQRGDRPPEKFRERINTSRTPVEALYKGRLFLRRNLSEQWLLTLGIESPVPVESVRWAHRPFLPHPKDPALWTLDLSRAAQDARVEMGALAVDVLFADGNRLRVK